MSAKLTKFINLINSKKIYFILIFLLCILAIAGFVYYENNKPTSVAGYMRKADNLAKNGKIAYAIEDYNKIVRVFSENYEAHIHLAELYVEVNEPYLAKVEYMKAINLGYKSKYQANIAMANIYIKENNYTLAESFINEIKDIKDSKAQQLIGDFYYNQGIVSKKNDKTDAIRKFKTAYKYYKISNSPNLAKLKKDIINTYIAISNDLISINKPQDAIDILKSSLSFLNNAETHYRLAKIYGKQGNIDNAISEYKTAFNLNPDVSNNKEQYVQLLIKKAELLKGKGDKVSEEFYYAWAKKLDSKLNIPMNPDSRIIIDNLAAKCNENINKDILIPEVSLKLTNISKNKINYLKIKVVFLENNKPFSEEIKTLTSEKNPLNNDSSTSQINVFSSKPINYVLDKHNLQAQIYISQKDPDEWVLFRNVKIAWEIKPAMAKIEYLKGNKSGPEYKFQIEYLKALKLGSKSKYESNIALANLYIGENNYILAENFINRIKNMQDSKARQVIGDFYYKWGLVTKKNDKSDAIEKLKIAYKYYKISNNPNAAKIKTTVMETYFSISNDLANKNKSQDAIDILKSSLSFWDNAETHYRMAKIYEKQGNIDNAIGEYKIVFKLNPTTSNKEQYVQLLIKKAKILKGKGDKVSTELYYTWAKKLDSKLNVPINPNSLIILNNVATKCNENIDKDIIIPEVSFKLTNIGKNKINYLKIKVLFSENNKPFSQEIKILTSEKNPLSNNSSTSQINVFASKPVNYVLDKHDLQAQIYISQKNPDEWVLFRNLKIIWQMKHDIIIPK